VLTASPGPAPNTLRLSLLSPRAELQQIALAFALSERATGPVAAEEFEILEQRLYDERGAPDDSIRFSVDPLIP